MPHPILTPLPEALLTLATSPGLTVALVASTHGQARRALLRAAEAAARQHDAGVGYGVRLFRAAGAERVEWDNGSKLIPLSVQARAGGRGYSLDAATLVDVYGSELPVELLPAFATSRWPGAGAELGELPTLDALVDQLDEARALLAGVADCLAELRHRAASDDVRELLDTLAELRRRAASDDVRELLDTLAEHVSSAWASVVLAHNIARPAAPVAPA